MTSCHAEVYLFVRIEKVLQGSLSQACDQYLKAPSGNKIYKQMKQFCSQIGHHRMPFGWAARLEIHSDSEKIILISTNSYTVNHCYRKHACNNFNNFPFSFNPSLIFKLSPLALDYKHIKQIFGSLYSHEL